MNTDTGELRHLTAVIGTPDTFDIKELFRAQLKQNEILVNEPRPFCIRCQAKGSIPRADGTRPERRRAEKAGLPVWSKFMACPECNPDGD